MITLLIHGVQQNSFILSCHLCCQKMNKLPNLIPGETPPGPFREQANEEEARHSRRGVFERPYACEVKGRKRLACISVQ
jgi:hypothetical protein